MTVITFSWPYKYWNNHQSVCNTHWLQEDTTKKFCEWNLKFHFNNICFMKYYIQFWIGSWNIDKTSLCFSVWKVFQIAWRICQRRSKTTKNPGKETKTPSSKAERRNHRWKNSWKVLSKVFKNCHLYMETHFCQNWWRLGISGHLGYFDGYYQLHYGLWHRHMRSIKVNMDVIKGEIANKF